MGKTLKSYAQHKLEESLREYDFYRKRFKRLLLTMFNWKNLPDGISERFIEETLYQTGSLIFFKTKAGFLAVAKATQTGLNPYNEPIGYHAKSDNFVINEYVKAKDCVPIWNNYFREGNVLNVDFYAKRLCGIEKTIDINLEHMKRPYLIACTEGMKATVDKVLEKTTNGEPYILVSDTFRGNIDVSVLNLDVKNFLPDLQNVKRDIISEALTFFGVNNLSVHKKERLVTNEVDSNNEEITLNKNTMLKCRQEAVEKINKQFNTNISVELSTDLMYNVEELERGEE